MFIRIVSALVAVVLLLAVVMSGNMAVLSAALCVCALLGIFELFKAFGFIRKPLVAVPAALLSLAVLLNRYLDTGVILAAVFVYVLLLVCQLLSDRKGFAFSDLALAAMSVGYVSVPLLLIFDIRSAENGFFLLWIALGGAWITDIFAYFCGRFLGKHKLCPSVSPKKTVEGSVGGSLFTVAIGLLYGFLVSKYGNIDVSYVSLGVLSLICAVVSQLGDLTASVIKREKGIKDFGNLMPGHGGFMDRFDSTLFVAPAVFVFNMIFPIFM